VARNLKVEARLIADTGAYTAGIRRAMADTDRFGRSTKKAGRSDPFSGLAKNALKAAAATASLYTVYDQGKKAVNTTLDLAKSTKALTRTTGLSTQEASRFVAVAKVRGIENAKLAASFTILSKQIVAAQKGSEGATSAFQKLGVSQDAIAQGNTREVFLQAADGLSKMANGANKTALAAQLFGRGYQALFPLLDLGAKGIAEQLQLAGDLGAELSGNSTKSVLKFAEAQRQAKLAQMGLQVQLGQVLIPTLTKGVAALSQFIIQFRQGTGAGGQLRSTLESIRAALQPVATLLGNNPRLILAAAGAWVTFKTTVGGLRLAETILNVLPTAAQMFGRGKAGGSALGKGLRVGLAVGLIALVPDISAKLQQMVPALKRYSGGKGWGNLGSDLAKGLSSGFMRAAPGIFGVVSNAIAGARAVAKQSKGGFLADGKALAQKIGQGLKSAAGSVASAASAIASKAYGAVKGFVSQFFGVGQSMGAGLAGGIRSAIGQAVQAARDIILQAKAAAKAAAKSKSPSRVFMEIGADLVAGMALGMAQTRPVVNAARNLSATAAKNTGVGSGRFGTGGSDLQLLQAQAQLQQRIDSLGSRNDRNAKLAISRAQKDLDRIQRELDKREAIKNAQDQLRGIIETAKDTYRAALEAGAQATFNNATALSRMGMAARAKERERAADTSYLKDKASLEQEIARAQAEAGNPAVQARYAARKAALEARYAAQQQAGNLEAADQTQQELLALEERYGPQRVQILQDQLATVNRDYYDVLDQRTIDSAQAQLDATQAGIDGQVAAWAAGLTDINNLLANFTGNYMDWVAQVNAALPFGLTFTADPGAATAINPPRNLPRVKRPPKKKRASGGPLSRAGLTLVGETGPELIANGNVFSATKTARMNSAGGVTLNVYPQTTADDPVALARALGWQLASR